MDIIKTIQPTQHSLKASSSTVKGHHLWRTTTFLRGRWLKVVYMDSNNFKFYCGWFSVAHFLLCTSQYCYVFHCIPIIVLNRGQRFKNPFFFEIPSSISPRYNHPRNQRIALAQWTQQEWFHGWHHPSWQRIEPSPRANVFTSMLSGCFTTQKLPIGWYFISFSLCSLVCFAKGGTLR